MRGDELVKNQLLMAQTVSALSDHLDQSTGIQLTPVPYAQLPSDPQAGMIACVTDSSVNTWGAVITPVVVLAGDVAGGTVGAKIVGAILAFYNGTDWTVAGK